MHFLYCSSLTSITIPEGVRSIGENTFSGCSSLTSITIPEGVTEIGNYAFRGCSSLTSITIPEGVTEIGWDAFKDCSSLTSITIPEGVKEIGESAFEGCSSLTSITIPEGVTEIGWATFRGCSSLTSITISKSVRSIGYGAFEDCSSLRRVENHSKIDVKKFLDEDQIANLEELIIENNNEIGESDNSIFKFDVIDEIVFKDNIFVLTGFGKEEEENIIEFIESNDGIVKSSTVLKTRYLVVMEEYDHKTTKYKKALELKEKGKELYVISSKMFYELVK